NESRKNGSSHYCDQTICIGSRHPFGKHDVPFLAVDSFLNFNGLSEFIASTRLREAVPEKFARYFKSDKHRGQQSNGRASHGHQGC
ncbi:MAG: hypothetical protein WBM06_04705, partial [Pseudolabrys sp.]